MAAASQPQPPPPTATPAAASLTPTASPASRRSPAPSPARLLRRQSTQDRIDQILETARGRAETLSPRRMEPLLGRAQSPRGGTIAEHAESSADESHGRGMSASEPRGVGPHVSYQGTATTAQSGSSLAAGTEPRSRRKSSQVPPDPARRGSREAPEAGAEAEEEKWWHKVLSNFTSIELENKGSVARDHLALERTFLAWLRTSLAFASIGIAITQLFRLNTTIRSGDTTDDGHLTTLRRVGKPLGATFLIISILVLFLGYNRYNASQRWILRGKFPASRGTVIMVSTATFALMIVSLAVVIVVPAASPKG